MIASLANELLCLDCAASRLVCTSVEDDGTDIRAGCMTCASCGSIYPIVNSVPIMFANTKLYHFLAEEEKALCEEMGIAETLRGRLGTKTNKDVVRMFDLYQFTWPLFFAEKNAEIDAFHHSKQQFVNFNCVDAEDIDGKEILIAGGGFGRETMILLEHYSPRRIYVLDMAMGTYDIREKFAAADNVHFIRCDMTDPVFNRQFDTVISDHVMQHVADLKLAILSLSRNLKPGGRLAINHYSRENNWLMIYGIEPAKRLLSFLGPRQYWYISYLTGALLYLLIWGVYKPLNSVFKNAAVLPVNDTMMYWSKFSFYLVRITTYDLLTTPITHFRGRAEIEALLNEAELNCAEVKNHAGTFWCFGAEKSADAPQPVACQQAPS